MAMSPEEVNQYLEKHGLEAILAEVVNEAVSARAEDPVSFIADALTRRAQADAEAAAAVSAQGIVTASTPADAPADDGPPAVGAAASSTVLAESK